MFRTDENNNPAAFTTDIAAEAGLVEGTDYVRGTPFTAYGDGAPKTYYTAKLLGDPVELTIRVIGNVGYYTRSGNQRWSYIALPRALWNQLTHDQKRDVIGFHYRVEEGTEMLHLFPNFDLWRE